MDSRSKVHELLCNIMNTVIPNGDKRVYFQPPESKKIEYPAIIYYRSDIDNVSADNKVYRQTFFYEITVIDADPDSEIVQKISALPRCRFNRHYTADNLNHDIFTLYI